MMVMMARPVCAGAVSLLAFGMLIEPVTRVRETYSHPRAARLPRRKTDGPAHLHEHAHRQNRGCARHRESLIGLTHTQSRSPACAFLTDVADDVR
jgi:hypothetical protein